MRGSNLWIFPSGGGGASATGSAVKTGPYWDALRLETRFLLFCISAMLFCLLAEPDLLLGFLVFRSLLPDFLEGFSVLRVHWKTHHRLSSGTVLGSGLTLTQLVSAQSVMKAFSPVQMKILELLKKLEVG